MNGIERRSIIVTGGASGIGAATVRLLAENGASVTIADIDEAEGESLANELKEQGMRAQFIKTNISSEPDVIAMVNAAIQAYGRLDGAVNNAAVPNVGRLLHEISLAEWTRCHEINVAGTFLCLKHEIAALLKTGGGSIINTSSVTSLAYVPLTCEYSVSKYAVSGLTKAAAAEYGHHNIRVNAIAPSTVRTPMYERYIEINPDYVSTVASTHLLGRASEPIEQAAATLWLLSDAASFVTGVVLPVDGGYTVL